MIYITANELDFRKDFHNFYAMVRYHPGVKRLRLFVVVSDVEGFSGSETKFFKAANKFFHKSRYIKLEKILIKGNIGRDLSSAKVGLDEISNLAEPSDSVMIRNRSAIGPFTNDWYSAYLRLFQSAENIGLVGNTINLQYHEDIDPNRIAPHVQTYLYFSSYFFFNELRKDFPGINEIDRLRIICHGEIAISEKIMNLGYEIACLFWQDEFFGKGQVINEALPKKDIKESATGLPFIHRHGLKGRLKRRFLVRGWLGLAIYSLMKEPRTPVQTKRLNQFYV